MAATLSRPIDRSRFAWLLWFALLVPLAQFAASWHAQSHWDPERTTPLEAKHALAGERCDLCLTAAAITGGAATSTSLSMPGPLVTHPPAQIPSSRTGSLADSLAYESRAPPHAFR